MSIGIVQVNSTRKCSECRGAVATHRLDLKHYMHWLCDWCIGALTNALDDVGNPGVPTRSKP